jgi:ABC-type branched-subunit amino acid transport system substrate-binding protein
VLLNRRVLATAGAACLAGLAIAGCSQAGSSSSSTIKIVGHTLAIYISEPAHLNSDPVAQDVVDAEKLAFTQQSHLVTHYKLVLRTPMSKTLSDNARQAIIDKTAIAYLGEIAPGTSDQTVGINNALDLLEVSPTDTALELAQSTPAVTNAPKTYFESWGTYHRTFARVVPSSAVEAKTQVAGMKSLAVSSLYIGNDGSDYGKAIADAVSTDAKAAGLKVAASSSGAGADFYGATSPTAAAKFFNTTAAASPTAKLFGPSSLNAAAFTSALSPSVHNLYVSIPGFMPNAVPAAGKTFIAAFKAAYHHAPNVEAIFGYAAMSAVLQSLKRAGGQGNNRSLVASAFLSQHKVSSVLGTYSIGSNGNTSLNAFIFARPSGGALVPFRAAPSA